VSFDAMAPTLLLLLLTAWPEPGSTVQAPMPVFAKKAKKLRVVVDAGHGAPGNDGNHGCFCQAEMDHTWLIAQHLGFVLSDLGGFEVMFTRTGEGRPTYQSRIAAAEAWKPDFIVSLHSDARGEATLWKPFGDERECARNPNEPGFAVRWSDVAEAPVVAKRAKLGRSVGQRLREAGFRAYTGENYGALYKNDTDEPSGWVDIRPPKTSVYFLKASTIPTIIIETHHALDPVEVARWDELKTADAFALAVAQALLDAAK
jgi:N-acetylmuramoyl-L-alanine amidase